MKKRTLLLLLSLLVPLLFLSLVVDQAQAQSCQYTTTYTFDSDEGDWKLDSVEWDGSGGHNAAGQLHGDNGLPGADPYAVEATLPVSALMQLWGLPLTTTVTGPGASIGGYARYMTPGGYYYAYVGLIAWDGGNGGYFYGTPVNTTTWTYSSRGLQTNYTLESFVLFANGGPDDSYWDDVTITIDCSAMEPNPNPNPNPTPEPTPTRVNPLAELWGGGSGVGPPEPFPLPTPNPDYDGLTVPLWEYDTLNNALRAVLTVFVLANKNRMITITLIAGAFIMALTWAISLLRERSSNV